MKPLCWDKRLGLALPLERAAGQSNQTNNPSKNEVGLDVSHHTRVFSRGGEKFFFLTSSFIGLRDMAMLKPTTGIVSELPTTTRKLMLRLAQNGASQSLR